jgi:uncharacterized membrane protein
MGALALVLGALVLAFGIFWAVAVGVSWEHDGDSVPELNLAIALAICLLGAALMFGGVRRLRR